MTGTYGNGAPFFFDYNNAYTSMRNPSTMQATDTGLSMFFQRYLLQRAMSNFKWNMPKEWAKNYFLYCLYCWGYVAIIKTDKFGIIPQACTLKGYTVMYQPYQAVVVNPLFNRTYDLVIDKQCALVRLQPDYGGVMDLVTTYADYMALTAQTAGLNIVDSKLAYVFGAQNKNIAESFKTVFDKVASGEPAVVVDKQLLTEDGKPTWFTFANNLRANYIAGDLLADLMEWEKRFDAEIGIPHTNDKKKERLVSGEVNANAQESYSRADMWLESMQQDCEKASSMFNIDLNVEWRVNPLKMTTSMESEENANVDAS